MFFRLQKNISNFNDSISQLDKSGPARPETKWFLDLSGLLVFGLVQKTYSYYWGWGYGGMGSRDSEGRFFSKKLRGWGDGGMGGPEDPEIRDPPSLKLPNSDCKSSNPWNPCNHL